MLLSSSVMENDHAEWVANTAYTVGTYVIRPTTHRIYSCTGDVNGDVPPETDTQNWNDEGPTNRWAMFDTKLNTVTEQAESLTVQIQPGLIDSLAFLGAECQTIHVEMVAEGEIVYEATYNMIDPNANVGDWGGYFYEPVEQITYDLDAGSLVDLTLNNTATYSEGVLNVTLSAPGETVKLGMLVVGLGYDVGKTQNDPDLGIENFTLHTVDEWGNPTDRHAPAAKNWRGDVEIETDRFDAVFYELYRTKDDYSVWIPTSLHGSMIIYGRCEWRMKRKNSTTTMITMEIEGTT
ncbi:hypothetical protein AVO42_00490 [Thiomicrospira sp. XS5]|nr:hypothetical protein AVO42_00490 [Thiomicrospira sp. XS5]